MKDWIAEVGTLAVMLVVVLAVAFLAVYTVAHDPSSDTAKELVGALLAAFGGIIAHLWNQGPPSPPAGAGRPPA